MMAYEGSEIAQDNFGKFIYQLQPETKTLIRKTERILYRQMCLYYSIKQVKRKDCSLTTPTHTHTHTHTHIYIYIYIRWGIVLANI